MSKDGYMGTGEKDLFELRTIRRCIEEIKDIPEAVIKLTGLFAQTLEQINRDIKYTKAPK